MMIDDLKYGVNKKSVVAFILFGAIIVVFIFFGYQGGKVSAGYAARVNSHIISIADFQMAYDQMQKQQAMYFGDKFNKDVEMQKRLRNSALDDLIEKEAVAQGAAQEGFFVTNAEIRDYIIQIPAFQKDGVFQRSYYDGYIQNVARVSASRFEDQLKKDLAIDRMRNSIFSGFLVSDAEAAKIQQLKSRLYTIDFVKLNDETHKEKMSNLESSLRDPNAFQKELNQLGLKWETAKAFSMDANLVSEIGYSDKLMGQIFRLNKKGEMIPEMITTSKGSFVIRLNKIENKASQEDLKTLESQMAGQRASEAFSKWANKLLSGYSIEKNSAIVNFQ